jgi:D-beta-D-heptose 7-phosphate kinase / D-beta-D-heptose 1-phosphate adenosyltransferase
LFDDVSKPPAALSENPAAMHTLLERLATWRPFTAMVVGDFMLDQSVFGAAERLSPDAPVPVLAATSTSDSPGGASNVALCIRGLLGNVLCVGVVGADHEGRVLRNKLAESGCEVDALVEDPSRPTTVKRSLIGLAQHRHPQKMFRLDYESREPLGDDVVERILTAVDRRLDQVDVVCLEDYNKGVCTPDLCRRLIDMCRRRGKPVLIDPAAIESYAKYKGATAITPNRSEAELATGMETPIDATDLHNVGLATKLLNDLDLDAVVLTLDKHGALLECRGEKPIHVPTVARLVYDVTGAGDMVLAALAGAISNGLTWLEAVTFANAAAGLEVEVFGAQPVPLANVQREILLRSTNLAGKLRTIDQLLVELAVHRSNGHRVVLTNGCFDVIHAGHVGYLREARRQGDVLVVGVNGDKEVKRQKGAGRPMYPIADRVDILSELHCIDYVVVFEEPTAHELIRLVAPDVYVKGGDYRPEDLNEWDLLEGMVKAGRLRVEVLAHRPGLSSTTVIRQMKSSGAESPAIESPSIR